MTPDASVHTIFLVDDDAAVLRAHARMLRADGWAVTTFESAEAFLADRPAGPGCLVLDVSMPGLDGLELQQRLRDSGERLPIVFLTGNGDIPMSVRAIKAGAADFLTKPVQAAALDAAIRSAIEQHASRRRRHADTDGDALRERIASLSARERAVLELVVAGKLNKQIAFELGIVEQTVKYHRARIMERLQVESVAQLMHFVAKARAG